MTLLLSIGTLLVVLGVNFFAHIPKKYVSLVAVWNKCKETHPKCTLQDAQNVQI